MEFLRRTWANVSMDNLAFNYKQLRGHVASGTKFLGVVKGDAYGHGAVAISRYLEELGAEYLAVSNLEEAMQIRRAEVWLPILILGYTPPNFAEHEANYQIRQEVNDIDYARQLNAQLEGTGKRLHIHIKLCKSCHINCCNGAACVIVLTVVCDTLTHHKSLLKNKGIAWESA